LIIKNKNYQLSVINYQLNFMEAIAKAKYLKGSPRKARLVIDLIRGRNVSQALAILKFTNKRAAEPIAKCLNSAIANATYLAEQNNIAVDPDDLWVKTCFVDMGPTKHRRRMRPAPQGRAYREQRHYCHITIEVTSEAPAKKEEKEFVKRGKKVTAKQAGGENEAKTETKAKTSKKAAKPKAAEVEETKVQEPAVVETETAAMQPEETATTEKGETVAEAITDASEQAEAQEAENKAEASDAKDTTTQNPEELNETKRADDKQEDVNEQLERQ
jgi:large subunit ribosomal protein L22